MFYYQDSLPPLVKLWVLYDTSDFMLFNMEGAQEFDDLKGLEKSLRHQVQSLNADLHPSHNPVYLRSIKKKIRYVKWILNVMKSDSFTHQDLLDMIDSKQTD